jgi:hypothetical protein
MGRFEREDSPEGVPPTVGTATQDLRETVEAKLHEIVEAAEARAHEIEDRALEQALEIEQDSERRARTRFESSSERSAEMVQAIDAFEREVVESLRTLRERAAALASELGFETPTAPAPEQQEPVAVTETVEAEIAEPEHEEAAPEAEAPEAEMVAAPDDAREDVRKQILDLFMSGKPRVEAERLLGRIEDGSRYIDLLDEVYEPRAETQQGSSRRRRGGRRRRRPGSP